MRIDDSDQRMADHGVMEKSTDLEIVAKRALAEMHGTSVQSKKLVGK